MVPKTASKTALLVAGARWQATNRNNPICTDPWAGEFAGEEGKTLIKEFNSVFPQTELIIALRTFFVDHQVQQAIRSGVRQVVIIGAGFDSRSVRFQNPNVTFFEVDHPESQRIKQTKIRLIEQYPRNAAFFVPCDLATGDLKWSLIEAGLSVRLPTLWILEGVAPYLSEDLVSAFLKSVVSLTAVESSLVFDFVKPAIMKELPTAVIDFLKNNKEPVTWTKHDPSELLLKAGFDAVTVTDYARIHSELFGGTKPSVGLEGQGIVVGKIF
jgi:methyltransferase (TIGR00027 family)